jgi:hypothetical protein
MTSGTDYLTIKICSLSSIDVSLLRRYKCGSENNSIALTGHKRTVCPGADAVDAVQDVCEMLSHYYDLFLRTYNNVVNDDNERMNSYGEIYFNINLDSVKEYVRVVGARLGRVTARDLKLIARYKQKRNRKTHKQIWQKTGSQRPTLDQALRRLRTANAAADESNAIEKCLRALYARGG